MPADTPERSVLAEAAELLTEAASEAESAWTEADEGTPGEQRWLHAAITRNRAAARLRQVEQVLDGIPDEDDYANDCEEFVRRLRAVLHPTDATEGADNA